jgi:iron complex transport system substrate-binding protein
VSRDETDSDGRTRREYVKYGGVVVGGGLLAGCAGQSGSGSTATETSSGDRDTGQTPSGTTSGDADSESTAAETGTDTPTGGSGYSVTLPPVGEVQFDSVPERWVAYQYGYGDMGVALGEGEGYVGTNKPENYPDFFYDELPGVDFDAAQLTDIGSGDKEIFYELDPDVLFLDPNNARSRFDWSDGDIREIRQTVAPFFGHFGRRYGYRYQANYPQLGLYDLFETVAEVFRKRERYERVKAVHDDVMAQIRRDLPSEAERPTVGLLSGGSNVADGTLYLMEATAPGYGRKQYRDLGVRDVLENVETDSPFYRTDFEELLELDPDAVVVHWTVQLSDAEFETQFVEPFEANAVGSELQAVQNGRIYRGGTAEQGPIINLFQTELAAQQLYPETVGDGELFSRETLAAAITSGGAE